jgi:hypothetical protein
LGQPDAEKNGHFLFSTGAALVTQNVESVEKVILGHFCKIRVQ